MEDLPDLDVHIRLFKNKKIIIENIDKVEEVIENISDKKNMIIKLLNYSYNEDSDTLEKQILDYLMYLYDVDDSNILTVDKFYEQIFFRKIQKVLHLIIFCGLDVDDILYILVILYYLNKYDYMKYINRTIPDLEITLDDFIFGRLDYFHKNYDFNDGFELSNNHNYNKLFLKDNRF